MAVKIRQHKGKWWVFIDHQGPELLQDRSAFCSRRRKLWILS